MSHANQTSQPMTQPHPIKSVRVSLVVGLVGLLGGLLAPSGGCRSAAGKPCRATTDCRDGLVCVVGTKVLAPDAPLGSDVGECVEDDQMVDDETSVSPPEEYGDLPSRRDLGTGETTSDTSTDTGDTTGTTGGTTGP